MTFHQITLPADHHLYNVSGVSGDESRVQGGSSPGEIGQVWLGML